VLRQRPKQWAWVSARLPDVRDVEVEYAVRDGASIAYEVFGDGPVDVALQAGRFPIDLLWDLPQLAAFLDSLGRMARVVVWDRRGCGASDPLPTTDAEAGLESSAADTLAVLDAAGFDRPTLLDLYQGPSQVFFAATYPHRVRSLIVFHLRTSWPELRGYSTDQRKKLARALTSTRGLRAENPRVAHDPTLQRWWGRARRLSHSPEAAAREMEFGSQVDIESVLGSVRAPTLVLHRRDNRSFDVATSRLACSKIPNARFVEVPGAEIDAFLGDTAPVLAEIERFLFESESHVVDDRVLATVLFTDIVGSTEHTARIGDRRWKELMGAHDAAVRSELGRWRGREIRSTGDGVLATFDGPGRALRCAAAIRDSVRSLGVEIRVGVHTGEIEQRGDDIAGIAVVIAKRVEAVAPPGAILVTRTVVDLVAGSGIEFTDYGIHDLKGVPDGWHLYQVA
jgi:class 3 adenylate cyclase